MSRNLADAQRSRIAVEQLEDRCTPATLVGLSGNNSIAVFDSDFPILGFSQDVIGLKRKDALIGIDFRPADGLLYGVGKSGWLYTIDFNSGFVTSATRLFADPTDATNRFNPITNGFRGTAFGVDFNPTVDRLRIVSNTGQNLRVNPNTGGVITDAPLNYAVGDIFEGVTPRVSGAAYTNPDNDPMTGTTLFDIDYNLGLLATQNPPNNGTLNTVGPLNGNFFSSVDERVGFDIDTTNTAFATFVNTTQQGRIITNLFTVNLATGFATLVGQVGDFFGNLRTPLIDVAAVLV